MKTKFKQSNISISGEIGIHVPYVKNGFTFSDTTVIELTGSKGKTKSGVYELVNKVNGKRYIGMARNLETRFQRHCRDLENGNHHSKLMIEDFILGVDRLMCEDENNVYHPSDVFEMRVIIYCRPSELTFYEHLLIKYLNPEYNVHKEKKIEFSDGEKFVMDSIDLE